MVILLITHTLLYIIHCNPFLGLKTKHGMLRQIHNLLNSPRLDLFIFVLGVIKINWMLLTNRSIYIEKNIKSIFH